MQNNNDGDGERMKASPEVQALINKKSDLKKGEAKAEEQNKKIKLVNDQVSTWANRMIEKID